ncbi:MAG TPA: amino acid permease [Mycobacteriales bacterium]|nr:amino acid permease [Mycobacteriales bacterium]
MVATGTVVLSYLGFVFPSSVGTWSVVTQGVAITAFIVLSAVIAMQRLRLTQTIVNVVFVLYALAITVVVVAGVVHLPGHPAATDPTNWSAYLPSSPTGVNLGNWTFFGLVILALLGVEVPLNMGVEIRESRAVTRYLLWGSAAVVVAYLAVTWAIMVTVPAQDGQSASVVAVAQAAAIGLGSGWGEAVALVLAAFFLFITVVYNYSFARLVFVSGLDRALPATMAQVTRHRVPANAIWAQTVVAASFTALAFVVLPLVGIGGGRPVDVQTRVYDVLQAAVTVIWCLSMVVLFVDVLIILRRYPEQFRATRLAHPIVFWICSVLGSLAAAIGVLSTLSGSWTPLITNDAGTVRVAGATVHYGTWFWAVAGIAAGSLAVGVLLYLLGRRAHRPSPEVPPLS